MNSIVGSAAFFLQRAETGIDARLLLHREQYTVTHRPLPVVGEVICDPVHFARWRKQSVMFGETYSREASKKSAHGLLHLFSRQMSFGRKCGVMADSGEFQLKATNHNVQVLGNRIAKLIYLYHANSLLGGSQ